MAGLFLRISRNKIAIFGFSIIALASLGLVRLIFNIVLGVTYPLESAEIIGRANIALSLGLFIAMIGATGYTNVISKFVSDALSRNDYASARSIYKRAFQYALLLLLILSLIIGLLSPEIARLLQVDTSYLFLSIPIMILGGTYSVQRAVFYAIGIPNSYCMRELISDSIFFISFFIIILFLSPRNGYILIPFSVMYLVFLTISFGTINRHLPESKEKVTTSCPMTSFMTLSTMGTVLAMAIIYLSNLFIGAMKGPADAGLYAAAFSAASLVLLIPNGIGQVILPEIAFLWGKKEIILMIKGIQTWTTTLLILISLIAGTMIILSQDILALLFGSAFSNASVAMILILFGILELAIARPSISALVGTEYLTVTSSTSIVAFIIAIIMWLILIPQFSILGAAIGYLAAASINSFVPMIYATKKWKIDWKLLSIPAASFILLIIIILILVSESTISERLIATGIFLLFYVIINISSIRRSIRDIQIAGK